MINKIRIQWKNQRGYTLLELLTVVGLLSVIGVIVLSVIFISIRGTQKSDTSEVIRQNGEVALSQIVKNIRYAKSLDSPASCVPATTVNTITVTSLQDGGQTTYACSNNTISSNSASLLDTNAVTTTSCSFVCSQSNQSNPPTITIQYTLSAKGANNFTETRATTPFQSSVILRNYRN